MVDGDVEEALDLVGVQVDRQDAVGAGGLEHVGDQFGADGHAALVLAVLPRVPVVRDHGGDPLGAGAVGGVDEQEQFHQVVVLRPAGGLDDEDVAAAHVLVDLDERLAVGEPRQKRLAEGLVQVPGDGLGQGAVGAAGEESQLVHVAGPLRFLVLVLRCGRAGTPT